MAKFIISWDIGEGVNYDVVHADSLAEAEKLAYGEWRQDAENNAIYEASAYTKDLAELCDLD